MFPVLFKLGSIEIETYYVFWSVALCLMVLWTRKRAVGLYGISYNDASDVLFYTLIGVLIGATLGGYADHWSRYVESPVKLLRFWESGLSSGPGFIGGGLAGLYKLRKLSVSVNSFAESASIPCCALLFIGRWGCFLNGCCHGVSSNSFCAVTFPGNPGVPVIPTQLFESSFALGTGILLFLLERKSHRTLAEIEKGALLWPLFLILYGSYRLLFDFLRAGDRIFGLRVGQYTGLAALVVGVAWLIYSKKSLSAQKS